MLKAQWIDQITDYEVYDRSKLDGVNGSKKEFVLIPKSSLPIFQQVLNGRVPRTNGVYRKKGKTTKPG